MTAGMFSRLPDQKTSQIPSGLPHRPSTTKHDEAWRSMTKHDEAWRSMTKHDEAWRSMTNWWFKCRSSIRPWVDLFAAPTFQFVFYLLSITTLFTLQSVSGSVLQCPTTPSLWAISIWKVDDLPVPASSPNVTICHNVTMVWQNLKMFNCLKPKGLPRHFPWPLKHFPYSCGAESLLLTSEGAFANCRTTHRFCVYRSLPCYKRFNFIAGCQMM